MFTTSSRSVGFPSIRLLVLGDSSVGKTALISRIAKNTYPSSLTWTQEPNIQIMLHMCGRHTYFIEFIDVSGLIASKDARSVYYRKIDGIVLVFDSNNRNSYTNLKDWLKEYHHSESNANGHPQIVISSSETDANERKIPVFIIGNKMDLHSEYKLKHILPNEFNGNKDYGSDTAFMSAIIEIKYQRTAMNQLKKFFNSIITQIEQLKNKHLTQLSSVETNQATDYETDHTDISSKDTNISSTVTSLRGSPMSFVWCFDGV